MDSIVLRHVREGIYGIIRTSSEQIHALGIFLAKDVCQLTKNLVLECLTKDKYYTANASHSKLENNIVIITHLYDNEMPPYNIPFDKLVKLIDAWVKIYDDLPEYITITIDENYDFKITYEKTLNSDS